MRSASRTSVSDPSRLLADRFHSLDNLIAADVDTIDSVPGIGSSSSAERA